MRTFNLHAAKTQLSRLVAEAAKGDGFIIAKAGKPLVKVTRLDTQPKNRIKRIGFMEGYLSVPDDFDEMGRTEIAKMFGVGQ